MLTKRTVIAGGILALIGILTTVSAWAGEEIAREPIRQEARSEDAAASVWGGEDQTHEEERKSVDVSGDENEEL